MSFRVGSTSHSDSQAEPSVLFLFSRAASYMCSSLQEHEEEDDAAPVIYLCGSMSISTVHFY